VTKSEIEYYYEEACKLARLDGQALPTVIQRRLGIGYHSAIKLIDLMKERKYIDSQGAVKCKKAKKKS
jgi:DNA segregation ATPase FtsK/SpoIIIE-like protein